MTSKAHSALKESTIRDFFLGEASRKKLNEEALAAVERIDEIRSNVHIARDLKSEVPYTRQEALALCEAAIKGTLSPEALETIAFALYACDNFDWAEDDVLIEVTHDWSAPEINWPLTPSNLEQFKRCLLGSERYPEKPPLAPDAPKENFIFETRAVFHDPD